MSIAWSFGRACRGARIGLAVTEDKRAAAVGVTRGYIARIEGGRVNVSVAVMEKLGEALGTRTAARCEPARVPRPEPPSRCRSRSLRWLHQSTVARSRMAGRGRVDVSAGRVHGWVDLVAFHRSSRRLLVIEIKTRLDARSDATPDRVVRAPRTGRRGTVRLDSTLLDHVAGLPLVSRSRRSPRRSSRRDGPRLSKSGAGDARDRPRGGASVRPWSRDDRPDLSSPRLAAGDPDRRPANEARLRRLRRRRRRIPRRRP